MGRETRARRVYEGKFIQVEEIEHESEAGRLQRHEVVRHQPGVAVIALMEQSDVVAYGYQVVLVRHYRLALERELIEMVAGMMDEEDASPLAAAQRELREEAGMEAGRWDDLGILYSSPGFTDEHLTLFLARDVSYMKGEVDGAEELSLFMLPLGIAVEQALSGELTDMKTVAGLLRAVMLLEQERRGE